VGGVVLGSEPCPTPTGIYGRNSYALGVLGVGALLGREEEDGGGHRLVWGSDRRGPYWGAPMETFVS
jgi:hypothetical protein